MSNDTGHGSAGAAATETGATTVAHSKRHYALAAAAALLVLAGVIGSVLGANTVARSNGLEDPNWPSRVPRTRWPQPWS